MMIYCWPLRLGDRNTGLRNFQKPRNEDAIMAKGQSRRGREPKKPKSPKKPSAAPASPFVKRDPPKPAPSRGGR